MLYFTNIPSDTRGPIVAAARYTRLNDSHSHGMSYRMLVGTGEAIVSYTGGLSNNILVYLTRYSFMNTV